MGANNIQCRSNLLKLTIITEYDEVLRHVTYSMPLFTMYL